MYEFLTNHETSHPARKNAFIPPYLGGHDGADYYLIEAFISAVAVSMIKAELRKRICIPDYPYL